MEDLATSSALISLSLSQNSQLKGGGVRLAEVGHMTSPWHYVACRKEGPVPSYPVIGGEFLELPFHNSTHSIVVKDVKLPLRNLRYQ